MKFFQIILFAVSIAFSGEQCDSTGLFELRGIHFSIPLENVCIREFLRKSIGYLPKDLIHDGLPQFGSKRDDWAGKSRKHKGYDIYIDSINVLAGAPGIVIKIFRHSKLSGKFIKIDHGKAVFSIYVHLTKVFVNAGDTVKTGQRIGFIGGISGRAWEPQLHFELQRDMSRIDPLELIKDYYVEDKDIKRLIGSYEEKIGKNILVRDSLVHRYLNQKRNKTGRPGK